MKISEIQEEVVMERKLYLGVENFHPVAVNPSMEELKDMGMNVQEEPKYISKVTRDLGEGEKEYEQVNIRIFLDNQDPDNRILTQVGYNIIKTNWKSSTGKYLVINKYGSTTWLEEQFIGAELPGNMQWYVNEGVKKALRGEDSLVDFIKALYNLPYVNQKTTEENKKKGVATFEDSDLEKLFKGDFSDLRQMISVNAKDQKVGYLLGVREVEGKYRQTLFSRMPLKSYVKATDKTDTLVEKVQDAQDNGSFADVIFDLGNTKLQEFNEAKHVASPDGTVDGNKQDDDLLF